ncbi:MAG: mannose-1-phosphate guanylyltransferase [Candidatus Cloacimonetes bacterium]|nr:mannose-1-phosphate guanylyltransferase [Candidatus Cloacimonadota bacterium]
MIALIMAGGAGTRFWPLSRQNNPKQFLNILSDRSMIRMTFERLLPVIKTDDIFVVTAGSQRELTRKHLPELPAENIIVEPVGRNTAPCIALSLAYLKRKYSPDENMLVLPADHLIRKEDSFRQSLIRAEKYANLNNLVIFGIKPDYPATGYGYIEASARMEKDTYRVASFKEKPSEETALSFIDSGNYLWNSGMFLWKMSVVESAYRKYLPEMWTLIEQLENKRNCSDWKADLKLDYESLPRIPVDIGIMEKAGSRVVLAVDWGWSDVGSWKSLYDLSPKDNSGNVFAGDEVSLDSRNNYIRSNKFVSLIGVEDIIVIDTPEVLFISRKGNSEEVRKLVEIIKEKRPDLV